MRRNAASASLIAAEEYSESGAWRSVLAAAARGNLREVQEIAQHMLAQLRRGIHTNPRHRSRYGRNPYLYVFNPGIKGRVPLDMAHRYSVTVNGMISHNVHRVQYTHAEDGKDYQHDFETPTLALAGHDPERGNIVLLVNRSLGTNVWEDR